MDWDREDDEDSDKEKEVKLSPIEQLMSNILDEKKSEVIMMLLSKLSRRCLDMEESLNAQTILCELSENETSFQKLLSNFHLEFLIEQACDLSNHNI